MNNTLCDQNARRHKVDVGDIARGNGVNPGEHLAEDQQPECRLDSPGQEPPWGRAAASAPPAGDGKRLSHVAAQVRDWPRQAVPWTAVPMGRCSIFSRQDGRAEWRVLLVSRYVPPESRLLPV